MLLPGPVSQGKPSPNYHWSVTLLHGLMINDHCTICCSNQTAGEQSIANLDWLNHRTEGDTHTADWRLKLQKVMHNKAGVYRNEDLLAEGCVKMSELAKNIHDNIRVTEDIST